LAHWVREKGVLTLEQAVRLLTSRSADVFGIHDRGRLAPGLAADVTIFDPDTVGCSPLRRVRDQPAGADRLISDADGIEAVIVNGTPIREHGESVVDEGQVVRLPRVIRILPERTSSAISNERSSEISESSFSLLP
jgi:N-acyl-D-aspartate/D-glutamate deacylase